MGLKTSFFVSNYVTLRRYTTSLYTIMSYYYLLSRKLSEDDKQGLQLSGKSIKKIEKT